MVAISSCGMACFGSGGGFAVLTVGAVLFVVSGMALTNHGYAQGTDLSPALKQSTWLNIGRALVSKPRLKLWASVSSARL